MKKYITLTQEEKAACNILRLIRDLKLTEVIGAVSAYEMGLEDARQDIIQAIAKEYKLFWKYKDLKISPPDL